MIETRRLRLVPCDLPHFEAILHEEQKLETLLDAKLADEWLGFPAAREAMQPAYEHLKSHPEILGWWTYLFVHKPDRTLIGLGGFKGLVNGEGWSSSAMRLRPATGGAASQWKLQRQ